MEDYGLPQQIKIDIQAPTWELPYYDPKTDSDATMSSDDLVGKWHVVFFYPADFTFVCPTELKDMADASDKFKELNVEILSASTDTVFSHRAWARTEKLMENFKYKMLSDHWLLLSELYNILDEQSGIAGRGTFIIDPDGICRGIEVTSGPLGRNSEELIRKIEALQFMRENPTAACPAKWIPGARTLTPSIKIAGEVYQALQD